MRQLTLIRSVAILVFVLFRVTILFAQNDTINRVDSQNRKQGYWCKYHKTGKKQYEGYFKDNVPVGLLKRYRSDGSLLVEMNYPMVEGSISASFFSPNGKVFAKGFYDNKLRDSVWLYYGESGYLRYQESYAKGVKNGTFKQYYPEGKIMEIANWEMGRLNGKLIQYFSNGLNRSVMNYSNGVLNGEMKVFYPDGKIRIAGYYADGLKQNEWTYYTAEGEVIDVIVYEKGVAQNKSDMLEQANAEFMELLKNAGKIKEPDIDDIMGGYY